MPVRAAETSPGPSDVFAHSTEPTPARTVPLPAENRGERFVKARGSLALLVRTRPTGKNSRRAKIRRSSCRDRHYGVVTVGNRHRRPRRTNRRERVLRQDNVVPKRSSGWPDTWPVTRAEVG